MALDLHRKVGPFTMGTWLGIGAAGVGLGVVIRKSSFFKPAPAPSPPSDDPGSDGQPMAGVSGAAGLPVFLSVPQPTNNGNASGADPIRDNVEWERRAVLVLIGLGVDALLAQSAIAKFMRHDPMTQQEAALVAEAIRKLGPPPQPVPPPIVTGPGPSTPPPGSSENVAGMSNADLLAGLERKAQLGADHGAYDREVIARVKGGRLSVNDGVWKQANGTPRQAWYIVGPTLVSIAAGNPYPAT